jgi:DNA-binding CsgD family transcriptional regulator
MSITTDRIAKANGIERNQDPLDAAAKAFLFEALASTLNSVAMGVIVVAHEGRILHADRTAQAMFAARSPVVSLGGCLCALRADRTKELRRAVAAVQSDQNSIGPDGIGVALVDKAVGAAAAHVLPLPFCRANAAESELPLPVAVVFVMPARPSSPAKIDTVARIFKLTPAEARLLSELVSGASLGEAATALGVAEATARTHRNHIFTKTGVSRRTDLMLLVARLLPPIRSY